MRFLPESKDCIFLLYIRSSQVTDLPLQLLTLTVSAFVL